MQILSHALRIIFAYIFNILGSMTMNKLTTFMNDESGATAIEYGLIAALVSVAIIGALTTLGTKLTTTFTSVSSKLN